MKTKALVTGAGGFLGSQIVKDLLKKDIEVFGLARNHYPEIAALGVHFIQCDLTLKDEVNKLDLREFDVIFHTAAKAGVWGSYDKFYKINFEGHKNLLDKAIEDKVKYFIYTSTPSVVFGSEDIVMGDESMEYPKKYYTHYAQTKAQAEKYTHSKAQEGSIKAISIRPHLIWGKGDPHLIPRVLEKAKKGRLKVVGDGNNFVDVIHVKNASHAHLLAYEALKDNPSLSGNVYFVGQEREVNLFHFLDEILKRKNLNTIDSQISFKLAYRLGFFFEIVFKFLGIESPEPPMTRFIAMQLAKSHYFSHAKAKRDLGYGPIISIEEGLEELTKKALQ